MVQALPSGSESARPFLPARDFETSKAFYEALGFEKELDDDEVAIFRVGATSFLLQNHFQREWAENFMCNCSSTTLTHGGCTSFRLTCLRGLVCLHRSRR
jgi:hypothetical protein